MNFASHKKQIQKASIPPTSTQVYLVRLYVSHQFLISLEESSTGMCSVIFIVWMVFLEWTEKECFECSLYWFSNSIRRSRSLPLVSNNEDIQHLNDDSIFKTQTSHICFLGKKTKDKRSLFPYARRHASIWISNVILKVLVGCWHIQIAAGYLSMSQKSSQVSRAFPIFTKSFARQTNIFP